MGRLIDGDLLIKELKGCTCTDKHDERIIKEFVVHIVKEQPTAYDVEAVVEQVEEMKTKTYVTGITWNPHEIGACSAIDRAIEIVRKGGVK